jgi:hypothetical protein
VTWQRRLGEAQRLALQAASAAYQGESLGTALEKTERARAALTQLESTAPNDLMKLAARGALAHVKSREELTETFHAVTKKP